MENELGQYIRKIRKDKKITLVQLAEKIGLSQPYLSQIENGKRKQDSLDPEILNKIAIGLGINQSDLWSKAYTIYSTASYASEMNLETLIKEDKELKEKKDILFQLKNKQSNVYLNGNMLTDDDRQRLIDGLKLIFPDYIKED
jgi:HTH-type transcriptional regulator, competence development regulator